MQANLDPQSILVVDDMPRIAITVEFLLRQRGYEVHRAADGRQGVELAKKHRPALILLDIMMPEMDGYQACSEIQKTIQDYNPTIWFLTGRGSEWDRTRAEELGVGVVITKPFDPDALVSQVDRFFSGQPDFEKDHGVAT